MPEAIDREPAPSSLAGNCPGENGPAAVALSFWQIGAELLVLCAGGLAGRLFGWLLPEAPGALVRTGCMALLLLAFLFPLKLGIKGWYLSPGGGFRSPQGAFACFRGLRNYLRAVWFGLVRYAAQLLCLLASALPAVLTAGVLQAVLRQTGRLEGTVYGVLLLLLALSAVLAVCFGCYALMGFFLMDYLWLRQAARGPFRAMALSFRMMRGERMGLVKRILSRIPCYLLCLTGAGLPFAMPGVRGSYAAYAAGLIDMDANDAPRHVDENQPERINGYVNFAGSQTCGRQGGNLHPDA